MLDRCWAHVGRRCTGPRQHSAIAAMKCQHLGYRLSTSPAQHERLTSETTENGDRHKRAIHNIICKYNHAQPTKPALTSNAQVLLFSGKVPPRDPWDCANFLLPSADDLLHAHAINI